MNLTGKVALITGSGIGIGRLTALTLAQQGANVVLNDIDEVQLQKAMGEVQGLGVESLAVKADVSQGEQVSQMVAQAVQRFGSIDILVNNVGFGRPHGGVEMADNEFKHLIDVNLKSQYLTCYYTVPHMKQQKSGKIINISSIVGKYRAAPADLAYITAKAGVLGLTRFLAGELGPYGINVNCVVPGNVLTKRGENYWNSLSEGEKEEMLAAIPLGRMASMEDPVNAILFLVSEAANYITGVSLDVNGGWRMS